MMAAAMHKKMVKIPFVSDGGIGLRLRVTCCCISGTVRRCVSTMFFRDA
jgi:hypothetical protein